MVLLLWHCRSLSYKDRRPVRDRAVYGQCYCRGVLRHLRTWWPSWPVWSVATVLRQFERPPKVCVKWRRVWCDVMSLSCHSRTFWRRIALRPIARRR